MARYTLVSSLHEDGKTFLLYRHENYVLARLNISGFGIGRHSGVVKWTGDGRHEPAIEWVGDAVTVKFPVVPSELLARLDGVEYRVTKGQ